MKQQHLLCLVTGISLQFIALSLLAAEPQFFDVFTSGRDGYPNYRIPSLVVTKKGIVLALCEGRTKNDDHAANDLVLKRSTDGGITWGSLQLVRDEGESTCNDPVMTALDNGRVLLFYACFPPDAHTKEVVSGYEGKVTRHFTMHSDDDGATWNAPHEVTRGVKSADAQATSQGAGAGLQLRSGPRAGRVLVPMWRRSLPSIQQAYVAISDDLGETWRHSPIVPNGRSDQNRAHNMSEATLVELADGTIMLNGRNWNGPLPMFRKVSLSRDGGETWSQCVIETQLPEPQCQGSLTRFSGPHDDLQSRLLFSNPNSQDGRKNGTIRLSYDDGKTWPVSKQLVAGTYRYSSLAVLADKTILCLFEQGASKTPNITLARFTLDWLTDGTDKLP